jgi:hypothetical protein
VQGWLRWLALPEPKVHAGVVARVLPYHVIDNTPERKVLTREESLIQLQERGLPTDLLNVLRLAPQPLDPGEDPDLLLTRPGAAPTASSKHFQPPQRLRVKQKLSVRHVSNRHKSGQIIATPRKN